MQGKRGGQEDKQVVWFPKFLKYMGWLFAGMLFTLGMTETIPKLNKFTQRMSQVGTIVLAALWLAVVCFFILVKPRVDQTSRLKLPGMQIILFFIGAIAILWVPRAIEPLHTRKVVIILDASQRMGVALDSSGITKFQAAKDGALQVLETLKSTDTKVALQVLYGSSSGQCVAAREPSTLVGFTQDYDALRAALINLGPNPAKDAPLVDAISMVVNNYLEDKAPDENFYIYSFLGGDDTCGRSLEVLLRSPTFVENPVVINLYLVILVGQEPEPSWSALPNTSFAFARNVSEVQTIVNTYNQQIVPPTPTATSAPVAVEGLPTGAEGGLSPTGTSSIAKGQSPNPVKHSKPMAGPSAPQVIIASATQVPIPSPAATLSPPPTPTNTPLPSATLTSTNTLTNTPTDIPTNSPTSSPTLPPLQWTVLTSQSDVFSTGCFLKDKARVFAQFSENQASISAILVSSGHSGQGLQLGFGNVRNEGWNYAGWEVWFGDSDQTGISFSSYKYLEFFIRGELGGEEFNVYLMMPDSQGLERFWQALGPLTTSWQKIDIPLLYFTTSQEPHQQVQLTNIQKIQFVFEWYPQPTSGTIFVDDLCVK